MSRFRFVLMRPRNPENLGAVARALKNFGFSDWAIVDPRTLDFSSARRVAVHAEDVLDQPKILSTLDEAVADCAWVVGTSSRHVHGKGRFSPEAVARESASLAPGALTAIVFGDERSGLTNAEVARCHALSAIPTLPEQPSVNLAQSVLLYAYEARRSLDALEARPAAAPAPADDAALRRIEASLRALLTEGGFLDPEGERHAMRDLMSTLERARLSSREARLWEAALRSCGRWLRMPGDIKN